MTRLQLAAFAGLLLVATVVALLVVPSWIWHPLGACSGTPAQVTACRSYNFWSGIEGDASQVAQVVAMFAIVAGFWHRHNCHQTGCLAVVRHGKTHCPKHEQQEQA